MKNLMEGNAVLVLWEDGEYRPEVITDVNYRVPIKRFPFSQQLNQYDCKHIPITPETVERLGVHTLLDYEDDFIHIGIKFVGWIGYCVSDKSYCIYDNIENYELGNYVAASKKISSIADLQNLIYLLTGEMPTYKIEND